ncbi:MAG TPA: TetR/AcrR family transcriptional regulator [Firmicutes bacterium]|nr:TetR/AcrR family transcriptional regulator [Bacillota bacterium]
MRVSKRPEERRQDFLDAAQALFYEQGVEATSIQQIVKRVGVAQGLYYYYFHSKKEIVEAVIVRLADRFEQELRAFVGTVKGSFHDRFEAFLDACFTAYRKLAVEGKWADPLFKESAILSQMSARVKAVVSGLLTEMAEEGVRSGEIHLPYPSRYIRVVVNGIGDLLLEGEQDLDMVRALIEEMIEGPRQAGDSA